MASRDPIWTILRIDQGRSLKWLARETGISYPHVKAVANGRYGFGPEFRRRCAQVMQLPESKLFLPSPSAVTQEAVSA